MSNELSWNQDMFTVYFYTISHVLSDDNIRANNKNHQDVTINMDSLLCDCLKNSWNTVVC